MTDEQGWVPVSGSGSLRVLTVSSDEANGDPLNVLITARIVNGNGLQSPWGPARHFPFHLCR